MALLLMLSGCGTKEDLNKVPQVSANAQVPLPTHSKFTHPKPPPLGGPNKGAGTLPE